MAVLSLGFVCLRLRGGVKAASGILIVYGCFGVRFRLNIGANGWAQVELDEGRKRPRERNRVDSSER
jgi:hypothetical protein